MARTFGAVITCIDGRIQGPVTAWVKTPCGAEYVDAVTLPGMDGLLARPNDPLECVVRRGAEISVVTHGSRVIAVAAHHDCAGNPVSVAQHEEYVRLAVERARMGPASRSVRAVRGTRAGRGVGGAAGGVIRVPWFRWDG